MRSGTERVVLDKMFNSLGPESPDYIDSGGPGRGDRCRGRSRNQQHECRSCDRQQPGHLQFADRARRELRQPESGHSAKSYPARGHQRALSDDTYQ